MNEWVQEMPVWDFRPVLDPRDPLPSARTLIEARYMHGNTRTLHHHRGGFYEWTGACYREADQDSILAGIWSFLESAQRKTAKEELVPFQPTRARAGDVLAALEAACNLPRHIEPPSWLSDVDMPAAYELLPVQNGLLHLPSGDLYPPAPDYFGLNAAGVSYDADAPTPVAFLRFLDEVLPGDPKAVETIQDWFGYCLTPDTSQQKIALFISPPRGGKGTLARILTRLLGQDNVVNPTLASMSTNFGLAPLIGTPLAIITDARLGARADQAAIAERLLSISGEDGQTIDRKFLSPWTGRLSTRFMILANEVPRLADASGALASRFIVVAITQSFLGREDPGLFNRILPELPGILNWAREGYLRMRERGYFIQPESARDAVNELEELGSPIRAFVKEVCSVGPGLQCTTESIFGEWRLWCEKNNRKEAGTAQTFGRDLHAAVPGLRTSQPRSDGSRTRIYEGIAVNYRAA